MAKQSSMLRPLNVSVALHEKTKQIAALDRKRITSVADELFLPVAEKRLGQLITAAAKNGGSR